MNTNTQPIFRWEASAKVMHERSSQWYSIAGALALTVIAYGIVTGAWAMSFLIALVSGLYFLVRNETHRTHTLEIYETGITYDGVHRPWADLKEFWILQGPGYHELHISSARYWRPDIVILLPDVDPYEIRDLFSHFLPQSGTAKEKILDAFIRYCKL